MKRKIITIGRQFGSGGHEIGEKAASRLGVQCYDRQLIDLAAKRGALCHDRLWTFDERHQGPWLYEGIYEGNHRVQRGEPISDVLFQLQSEVIRSIAKKENAVIVGRCADDVLRNMPGISLLSVFIAAPFENRVQRKMSLEHISRKKAEFLVRKMDKQRGQYYKAHTGRTWGTAELFDLYFDSSTQTYQEIVNIIVKTANEL